MVYKTDIEIAQAAQIRDIREIAAKIGLTENDIDLYGKYKAKVSCEAMNRKPNSKPAKLILTTAINPTPAGECKSTTTVGVADALSRPGKKVIVALREPSLGPVFGVKGGATGGGYAQVVPMEDINLHFTGDFHAIKPNLVQTLEGTPALIHGGPFANIAHGCNSVIAKKMVMDYADYVVTEAGFGADLGAEKFIDIKCRLSDIRPDAIIIVATIKALKYNGGVRKDKVKEENLEALENGIPNLFKHVENIRNVFEVPAVVALNKFVTDTEEEINFVTQECAQLGVNVKISEVWEFGDKGGEELAKEVIRLCDIPSNVRYAYDLDMPIKDKIQAICKKVYGADSVVYSAAASKEIANLEKLGYGNLPICMAKTQYYLTDDQTKLGRPEGSDITIREITLAAGAGFIVAVTGAIMRMPGLPKEPSAIKIDVDKDGVISGLF